MTAHSRAVAGQVRTPGHWSCAPGARRRARPHPRKTVQAVTQDLALLSTANAAAISPRRPFPGALALGEQCQHQEIGGALLALAVGAGRASPLSSP